METNCLLFCECFDGLIRFVYSINVLMRNSAQQPVAIMNCKEKRGKHCVLITSSVNLGSRYFMVILCHDCDCHCGHGPGCLEGLGAGDAKTYKSSYKSWHTPDNPKHLWHSGLISYNTLHYNALYVYKTVLSFQIILWRMLVASVVALAGLFTVIDGRKDFS